MEQILSKGSPVKEWEKSCCCEHWGYWRMISLWALVKALGIPTGKKAAQERAA
jgi:hypothetical protein